jgi:hypothetical protein
MPSARPLDGLLRQRPLVAQPEHLDWLDEPAVVATPSTHID